MSRQWVWVSRVLLVGWLLFLAWVLLQPSPASATGIVAHVSDALVARGLPETLVHPYRVEFVLNALMFAPLPFLGVGAFPRWSWTDWVAWAFVGSACAEVYQGLLLDNRSAQFVDIVANTAGALLGAVAAQVLIRVLRL